jgi:hypothetical protein
MSRRAGARHRPAGHDRHEVLPAEGRLAASRAVEAHRPAVLRLHRRRFPSCQGGGGISSTAGRLSALRARCSRNGGDLQAASSILESRKRSKRMLPDQTNDGSAARLACSSRPWVRRPDRWSFGLGFSLVIGRHEAASRPTARSRGTASRARSGGIDPKNDLVHGVHDPGPRAAEPNTSARTAPGSTTR